MISQLYNAGAKTHTHTQRTYTKRTDRHTANQRKCSKMVMKTLHSYVQYKLVMVGTFSLWQSQHYVQRTSLFVIYRHNAQGDLM